MNAPFFEALWNPGLPTPAGLTTWNGSDPAARFAIYRNNIIVSLIDALADTYPVTQALVGEEFFRAMAQLFVRQEPPHSPVLAFYGKTFPAFIETFPPATSVPYLADVARLEMLRVQAYHAADAIPLSADTIAQALAKVDELPEMKIKFQPSVGVLCSPYAVVSLWAAHQGITDISTVDPNAPENALILRPQLDVEVIRLTNGASSFIAILLQGKSLGDAHEAANLSTDFDLTDTLALLIQTQAISSINTKH